jgi:hypothetical protein
MKYSDLQTGDILQDHTFGRTYSSKILDIGFKSIFGNSKWATGDYVADAYLYECDGRFYIGQVYKHLIDEELHSVIRDGKRLVHRAHI